jgi:hypothetical protein
MTIVARGGSLSDCGNARDGHGEATMKPNPASSKRRLRVLMVKFSISTTMPVPLGLVLSFRQELQQTLVFSYFDTMGSGKLEKLGPELHGLFE